jgi:hypothetical protein
MHTEHANGPGASAVLHGRHRTTEPGEPAPRRLLPHLSACSASICLHPRKTLLASPRPARCRDGTPNSASRPEPHAPIQAALSARQRSRQNPMHLYGPPPADCSSRHAAEPGRASGTKPHAPIPHGAARAASRPACCTAATRPHAPIRRGTVGDRRTNAIQGVSAPRQAVRPGRCLIWPGERRATSGQPPRHHAGGSPRGNGAIRGTASVKRHPKLVHRRRSAARGEAREWNHRCTPIHTDGPSPTRPFMVNIERPTLASGAGAVALSYRCASVCIGVHRWFQILVWSRGAPGCRRVGHHHKQNPMHQFGRAAVTEPACTMRRIAETRRHTGLLPVRQRCGTRHSKQDSTQMQKDTR